MKSYLPIGTVVTLNNGTKKLMIYGRKQRSIKLIDGKPGDFDYVACLYPEGNINEEYIYLFNEDSIHEVHFRGYSDIEELAFLERINQN